MALSKKWSTVVYISSCIYRPVVQLMSVAGCWLLAGWLLAAGCTLLTIDVIIIEHLLDVIIIIEHLLYYFIV